MLYVEVLKKRYNNVGRTFCDAIKKRARQIRILALLAYLLLTACGGGGGGESHSGGEGGGELTGTLQVSAQAVLEQEPNQSLAGAQEVNSGARVSGAVTASDPSYAVPGETIDAADLYALSTTASLRVTLVIAANDLVNNDLDLVLLDPTGNLLDLSEGLVASEFIDIPTPGDYLIGVRGFKGQSNYLLTFDSQLSTASVPIGSHFVAGELLVGRRPISLASRLAFTEAAGPVIERRPVTMPLRIERRTVAATMATKQKQKQKKQRPDQVDVQSLRNQTLTQLKQLRQDSELLFVEPNYLRQPLTIPNDPHYPLQWSLPLLNLPQAWETTTGDPGLITALIDTGVVAHPDLLNRFTTTGYDFISLPLISNDGDGIDPDPTDPGDDPKGEASSFHGSHVAGILGASSNNHQGIAGVTWRGEIMPLRALGIGGGTDYDIAQAIRYAAGLSNDSNILLPAADRAAIINLSLGAPGFSNTVASAIAAARARGVILVAAAGNDNTAIPYYPAAYEGVISVAAVGPSLQKAPYSNFGDTIDLVAPGGNVEQDLNGDGYPDGILSTIADDNGLFDYLIYQGTSMATPHVSGIIGLMLAANPHLTPEGIDQLLTGTYPGISNPITRDLGPTGPDTIFGYGLLDAAQAVRVASKIAGSIPTDQPLLGLSSSSINFGSRLTSLPLLLSNSGGGSLNLLSASTTQSWLQVSPDSGSIPLELTIEVDRNGLAEGSHQGQINLTTDTVGSASIAISLNVASTSGGDVGEAFVLLIDRDDFDNVVVQTATNLGKGYSYNLTGVSAGSYYLVAGTDLDDDDLICDIEDACGFYPALLNLGSDESRSDLDFDLEYLVRPQVAADLPQGPWRLPAPAKKLNTVNSPTP